VCEPGKTIKLCTCEGLELDPQASWKLVKAGDFEELHSVGLFLAPSEIATSWSLVREKLLSDLNAGNCFDVDFKPGDGDWLSISLEDWQFDFQFTAPTIQMGHWKVRGSGCHMHATKPTTHAGKVKLS
jgi:hypothetical protein